MTEIPVLINRAFAGLFLRFGITGSITPKDNMEEVERESRTLHRLVRTHCQDKTLLEQAMSSHSEAMHNVPPSEPGPSIESICQLAREHGLEVLGDDAECLAIIDNARGYKRTLSIVFEDEDEWIVSFSMTDLNNTTVYFSVEYFQQPECPVLVCRPYFHPRAEHLTIPRQEMRALAEIDFSYCCDALDFQRTQLCGIVHRIKPPQEKAVAIILDSGSSTDPDKYKDQLKAAFEKETDERPTNNFLTLMVGEIGQSFSKDTSQRDSMDRLFADYRDTKTQTVIALVRTADQPFPNDYVHWVAVQQSKGTIVLAGPAFCPVTPQDLLQVMMQPSK